MVNRSDDDSAGSIAYGLKSLLTYPQVAECCKKHDIQVKGTAEELVRRLLAETPGTKGIRELLGYASAEDLRERAETLGLGSAKTKRDLIELLVEVILDGRAAEAHNRWSREIWGKEESAGDEDAGSDEAGPDLGEEDVDFYAGGVETEREPDDRPYQTEAMAALSAAFGVKAPRSVLLALPTGSGKTLVAAMWLAANVIAKDQRVLWLTHRIELLRQAEREFKRVLRGTQASDANKLVSSWTTEAEDSHGRVVLAMVQKHRRPKGHFDFLVIDEAHHAAANSYQGWREAFSGLNELLLTATPERLDKKSLGYDEIAYQMSFWDMVEQGYLARPMPVDIQTNGVYRLAYDERRRDFEELSLGALDNPSRNRLIVDTYLRGRDKYGKTLVFAINKSHAAALLKLFSRDPQVRAEMILADTDQVMRHEIVGSFRRGDLDVLINCRVFTEGFDCPDVKTVFLTRPTASPVLFCQMIGRGSRTTETKDTFFAVLFEDQLEQFADKLAGMWALGTAPPSERLLRSERSHRPLAELGDLPLPVQELTHAQAHQHELAGVVTFTHPAGGMAGAALVWQHEMEACRAIFSTLTLAGQGPTLDIKPMIEKMHWQDHVKEMFESAVRSSWRLRLLDFVAPPDDTEISAMTGLEHAAGQIARTVAPLHRVVAFLGDPAQVEWPIPMKDYLRELHTASASVAGLARYWDPDGKKWVPRRLSRAENKAFVGALAALASIPQGAHRDEIWPRIEEIYSEQLDRRTGLARYEWYEVARTVRSGVGPVHLDLVGLSASSQMGQGAATYL